MPVYLYQHPETGDTIEVVQKMKDEHIYVDDDGTEWNRVFFAPNASIDSNFDADMSSTDWMRKTENKKWTVGDAWDKSKELSVKRQKRMGKDPVKEKHFKDYKKQRRGKRHPEDKS
jgi:hypothetical protein